MERNLYRIKFEKEEGVYETFYTNASDIEEVLKKSYSYLDKTLRPAYLAREIVEITLMGKTIE